MCCLIITWLSQKLQKQQSTSWLLMLLSGSPLQWAQGIAAVSGVGKQQLSFPWGGCYWSYSRIRMAHLLKTKFCDHRRVKDSSYDERWSTSKGLPSSDSVGKLVVCHTLPLKGWSCSEGGLVLCHRDEVSWPEGKFQRQVYSWSSVLQACFALLLISLDK